MLILTVLAVLALRFIAVSPVPVLIQPRLVGPGPSKECGPASWHSIFLFLLLNYGAHALTLRSVPGESMTSSFIRVLQALTFPFTGVWTGCRAISVGWFQNDNELEKACRAGALCALRRTTTWKPREGETIGNCRITGVDPGNVPGDELKVKMSLRSFQEYGRFEDFMDINIHRTCIFIPDERKIHGEISKKSRRNAWLEDEYEFYIVPSNIAVKARYENTKIKLSKSHSIIKTVAALVQLAFACFTLYHARGNQIQEYGYAAFGFTVVPYAVMSLVNLIGSIVTPNYSSLFMVRSEVMAEAEKRGARFDGTVGEIYSSSRSNEHDLVCIRPSQGNETVFRKPSDIHSSSEENDPKVTIYQEGVMHRCPKSKGLIRWNWVALAIAISALMTPYALIAGFTNFEVGNKTTIEGFAIMTWLAGGQAFGLLYDGPIQIRCNNPNLIDLWRRNNLRGLGRAFIVFILVNCMCYLLYIVIKEMLKIGSCSGLG